MRVVGFGLVFTLFIAIAAFSVPTVFRFKRFCKHVASTTGRIADYENTRNLDDGGANAFEREQFSALLTGKYKTLDVPDLVAEGRVLSRQFRILYLLASASIALTVFVKFATR